MPSNPPPDRRSRRAIWLLIVVVLTPAVALPLAVGLYDRVEPTLAGFPFFYWFQLLLVLASCAVTAIAYFLAEYADRRGGLSSGLDRRSGVPGERGDGR